MAELRGIAPLDVTCGNVADKWKFWIQKFNNYLKANEIDKKEEDVQCAQFLQYIGDEGIRIFNTFKFKKEEQNRIKPLIREFDNFFQPQTNLVYERHKFFTRRQMEGESLQQFITDLKNKAKSCAFSDLEESLVCSMLIIGLLSDQLRERLLENSDMTLKKAESVCLAVQESRKQGQEITSEVKELCIVDARTEANRNIPGGSTQQSTSRSDYQASTNTDFPGQPHFRRVSKAVGRFSPKQISCFECGIAHPVRKCPAFGKQCNICGNFNHFQKMCRKRIVHSIEFNNDTPGEYETVQEYDDLNSNYVFIGMVNKFSEKNKQKQWHIEMVVNQVKNVVFKLDTGAMTNVINIKTVVSLNIDEKTIKRSNVRLTNYSNDTIPVIGECRLHCYYKNNVYWLDFVIVDIDSPAILGLDSCIELNIIKKIDSVDCADVVKKYEDIFQGIGCLEKPFHIQLKLDAVPKIYPARKIPFPLIPKFKRCLEEMESQGIIFKVDFPTEWVNPIVLVAKKDGCLRICLDPVELNKNIRREHYPLPTFEEISAKLKNAKYFSTLDAMSGFW
ncbi:uncharacterized protein [Leptinotarsa decemlineata]|uniref:uncharacterized protein n=1 Tax=Leptinotarsa decemlineata TaxID=7539 RepID=UPI003D3047CF